MAGRFHFTNEAFRRSPIDNYLYSPAATAYCPYFNHSTLSDDDRQGIHTEADRVAWQVYRRETTYTQNRARLAFDLVQSRIRGAPNPNPNQNPTIQLHASRISRVALGNNSRVDCSVVNQADVSPRTRRSTGPSRRAEQREPRQQEQHNRRRESRGEEARDDPPVRASERRFGGHAVRVDPPASVVVYKPRNNILHMGTSGCLSKNVEEEMVRLGAKEGSTMGEKIFEIDHLTTPELNNKLHRLLDTLNSMTHDVGVHCFEDVPRHRRWSDAPLTLEVFEYYVYDIMQELQPLEPQPRPRPRKRRAVDPMSRRQARSRRSL